ncbi:hypothetical protein NBRC116583_39300 [Arenicella sp. 4NH20-0111]
MLSTHAMQILLHYQDDDGGPEKPRFDRFLDDVRKLAEKHQITFEQYESFSLNGEEFRIAPCDRCKDLTVNKSDVSEEVKEIVSFFWETIRIGEVTESKSMCQICKIATS